MTTYMDEQIILTVDQERAVEAMVEFIKSGKSLLTLGGLAGTGKTFTISYAISRLRKSEKHADLRIAFVAFTGKASTVLRDKLIKAGALNLDEYCGTIHGLIYEPVIENDRVIGWNRVDKLDVDIVIIDEASMVGDIIFADLKSYGIPILAVGDHGQLPPVMSRFNLMEKPMIRLEKIHRQAEGNPIIKWSFLARMGEEIPFEELAGPGGERVLKTRDKVKEILRVMAPLYAQVGAMILCGKNKTRIDINKFIKQQVGRPPGVVKGEKVICLKNNRKQGIFNGMTGHVLEIKKAHSPYFASVKVQFDLMDYEWGGDIFLSQFNQEAVIRGGWKSYADRVEFSDMEIQNLFDFGYAMTVHKSQGSQAENVLLLEERMSSMSDDNWNRWLYTGITRSSKNLIITAES